MDKKNAWKIYEIKKLLLSKKKILRFQIFDFSNFSLKKTQKFDKI